MDIGSTNPERAPPQSPFNERDSARIAHPTGRGAAVSAKWCLFLLYGVAVGILGLILAGAPLLTPLTLMSFMGVYWFILGTLVFVHTYEHRIITWTLSLLICLVGVLAGIFIWRDPIEAAAIVPSLLIVVLGTQGLVMGALEVMRRSGSDKCAETFVLAAINLAFGLLLLQSAFAAALVASIVFGPLLFIQGVFLIVWACLISP